MRSSLACAVMSTRYGSRAARLLCTYGRAALPSGQRVELDREVDQLTERGVEAVLLGDPGYPSRLAACPAPPAALFYAGRIELVDRPTLAVSGAPEADGTALSLAAQAARLAVEAGMGVVTGGTRGVDSAAAAAAASGGVCTTVLAEGIRYRGPDLDGRVTISEFPSDQAWTVGAAMARNATIVGLSDALVAIGAGSTGGTLDAGLRALALGRPVLAIGRGSGSRLLVDYGATAAADAVELVWWLGRLSSLRRDERQPALL